jgi:hypothetical protein
MIGKAVRLGVIALAAVATLSACSSGNTKAAPKSTAKTSAARSANNGFGQLLDNPQAKACLAAAGIALPTARPSGSGGPSGAGGSGFPSGQRPSGFPSGQRPSNLPSGARPSGGAGGFGGQDSAQFQKIQAALTACGITVPTTGRSATPTPLPTSTG